MCFLSLRDLARLCLTVIVGFDIGDLVLQNAIPPPPQYLSHVSVRCLLALCSSLNPTLVRPTCGAPHVRSARAPPCPGHRPMLTTALTALTASSCPDPAPPSLRCP